MPFLTYLETANKCGRLLSSSRCQAGISRKTMSTLIGVSENTVRLWEDGQSSPTIFNMMEWFRITGHSYYRAMLEFFWPNIFKALKCKSDDGEIKRALLLYLSKAADPIEIKKFYYLVLGDHGSAWSGLLDMACAHEHTSLKSRYRNAEIIKASYEISKGSFHHSGKLASEIDINSPLLDSAIRAAKSAQSAKFNGYTLGDILGKDDKIVSNALLHARLDTNVSRKDLAKALGKSERTILNWENGFEPSFLDICRWFQALRKSFWIYIQSSIYNHDVHYNEPCIEQYRDALIQYFSKSNAAEIGKTCYLIMGEHGSNWLALLEALFIHANTPLAQRVITARSILISYTVDFEHRDIVGANSILPDIEHLSRCIELGTEAAKSGESSYYPFDCTTLKAHRL